jgi:CoA:oxalate CoA-transferase
MLEGLRVLDAGSFIAAPLAAATLGDWGADVVKLEPLEGDASRVVGPQAGPGMSATFVSANRGKRSVALDFRAPGTPDEVRRIVAGCDAVVHNLPASVARRLGLDPSTLRERDPGLVVCTVSAYGETGPSAGRPALDPVVQAAAGLAAATGPVGGEPFRCGAPIVDTATALAGAAAMLAALYRRQRTGEGAHVAVALLDVALAMQAPLFALRSLLGEEPPRRGNGSFALLGDQLAARDGLLAFVVWDDRRWRALCAVLGLDALADDARFADSDARCTRQDELRPHLAAAFARWDARDLEAALVEVGIPCAVTQGLDAVVADPQVAATGGLYDEARLAVGLTLAAPPVRMDGTRPRAIAVPPALGAHTEEVLASLDESERQSD